MNADSYGDALDMALNRINEQSKQIEALQARIDELMLEYCPDEMTQEQTQKWAKHQAIAPEHSIEALTAQVGVLREAIDRLWNGCENLHDNANDAYDRGYTRAMANSCKEALASTPEAALSEVLRAERERCAKVCESVAAKRWPNDIGPEAEECASLIRAMGDE